MFPAGSRSGSGTLIYLIRWENGHQSVFVPSSDSVVEHHPAHEAVS
jgi:hypothetical protein